MSNPHLQKVCSASIAGFGSLPVSAEGSTFTPSGKKRSHVAGCNPEDGGFTPVNAPAELDLSLNAKKTLNLQALGEMENVTITVKTTNGLAHVMTGAWAEDRAAIGDDGKTKIKFISNTSAQLNT